MKLSSPPPSCSRAPPTVHARNQLPIPLPTYPQSTPGPPAPANDPMFSAPPMSTVQHAHVLSPIPPIPGLPLAPSLPPSHPRAPAPAKHLSSVPQYFHLLPAYASCPAPLPPCHPTTPGLTALAGTSTVLRTLNTFSCFLLVLCICSQLPFPPRPFLPCYPQGPRHRREDQAARPRVLLGRHALRSRGRRRATGQVNRRLRLRCCLRLRGTGDLPWSRAPPHLLGAAPGPELRQRRTYGSGAAGAVPAEDSPATLRHRPQRRRRGAARRGGGGGRPGIATCLLRALRFVLLSTWQR